MPDAFRILKQMGVDPDKLTMFGGTALHSRGLTPERMLKNIAGADVDMLAHPEYFEQLAKHPALTRKVSKFGGDKLRC